ncbi:MAG: dihydrofolate reductase, partial [Pseudomonadota bacterium]
MTKIKPQLSDIKLCAIVAIAKNHAIGKDNDLIWHLPADLKHFKKTTMGKPMIMGRKSFESLPGLLPGRPHIVVTRSAQNMPEAASQEAFNDIDTGTDISAPGIKNHCVPQKAPEGP